MAGSMKAVKLRIKSVQSTMQITKAMQLVAASKLRKAKERADASKPYLETMLGTLTDIANSNTDFQSPFTKAAENNKWLYVVIAGDRGLAGGYNSNLFKFMEQETKGRDNVTFLPIGKKSVEYFKHRNVPLFTEEYAEVAKVNISDCFQVAKLICTNRTYLWEALHWRGLGFQDYLSKFRVRHFIQNAPQYRSMEKEEIAERCGFNDAKTLDKYLKQMFSISLSEYLKLMSRGESPT